MKANLYTIKGDKKEEITLPKEVFGGEVNLNLLAQAIHVYEDRSHVGLRNTKTRSEINRTTKKVYKQKGTGGARHGSRRANLFVGGGVVFGPRALRKVIELSQKIKNKAKLAAFSAKANEGRVLVLAGVSKIIKTKEVGEFLAKIAKEFKSKRFTFVLSDQNTKSVKFIRNVKNADVVFYKTASAFDIFNGGTLVIDQDNLEVKKEEVKAKKKETK